MPSHPTSSLWQLKNPAASLRWSLFLLALAALAAALLFVKTVGSPLCLAPLIVFAGWRFLPLLGEKADQRILIGFMILCLAIDDMSQVPWGRQLDILTEELGIILFKSYGLTGMEYFAIFFSVWLVLARSREQVMIWLRQDLLKVLTVGSLIFAASTLAGIYGLSTGANFNTYLIQTRFLHILPFWVFIGFVLLRDTAFTERLIFWVSLMVVLKSLQAVLVYLIYRDTFREAEYLIDHYFSAYSVIAFVALIRGFLRTRSPLLRLTLVGSALVVLTAYILNDRRTSYVGAGLACFALFGLLPTSWIKRQAPRLIVAALAGGFLIAATWKLPPPLGFIGSTIRSFGSEDGTEGPSYRDLENANIFGAAASSPLTGIGYGKEFEEKFPMPDISFVYERYRMLPHNLFLAAWGFGGPLTIAATSLLFVTMIWLAGRLIRENWGTPLAFFGIVALFYALQYFSYTFGDIGLQINRNQMFAGLFLGGCFRLLQLQKQGNMPRRGAGEERA